MYRYRNRAELEELRSQVRPTPKPIAHWGRDGIYVWFHDEALQWVSIEETEGLYPSDELYPSDTLYPARPEKYIVFDTALGPVVRDGIYIEIGD